MAVIRLPQNSFSNGILVEDRLRGRYDLKQYMAAARTLYNVNSHPQGGVYRRPGSIYIDDYTSKGPLFKFVKFDYSDDLSYFLIFYDDNIDVWKNNVLVHTISATGITGLQAAQMDKEQRANLLVLVHNDFPPKQLVRGANDVSWTLSDCVFSKIPLFGYSIATTNPSSFTSPAANLTPSAITGLGITFTAAAAVFVAGDVGKYIIHPSKGLAKIVSFTSTTVVLADIITSFPSTAAIASGTWKLDNAALAPSAISGNIRLVSSGPVFSAADVGGYVSGNGGEARITEYVSTTEVRARVILAFVDTTPMQSGTWDLESGYTAAWTLARGYPRAVAYDNDSLIFGGTASLPDVFWKSAIGDYFNFDDTLALSDSALTSSLKASNISDIRYIVVADDLFFFTSDSELFVDGKLTPDLDFRIRRQEARGCRQYIKPVFVDGAPMYIDGLSDVLREITYSNVEEKYNSTNLNLWSPGLLKDPIHIAHQKPAGLRDNDYIWIINSAGDWVTFNTLRKQDINGFTTSESRGDKLITCEDLDGTMYAMFNRTINGVEKFYFERFSTDVKMDCCKVYSGVATDTVTGLGHLEGEEVSTFTNSFLNEKFTVTGGEITLNAEYEEIVVGFPFTCRVVTLPPPTNLPDGTAIGETRRIVAVSLGLSDTGDITVNGQPVRTRQFGNDLFDASAPLIEGRKRVTLRGGYGRDPVVTIEQVEPLDFHLTDLILEVQV